MFILFILSVLADNIELYKSKFKVLHCFGQIIPSNKLKVHNSLKISFPGYHLLVYSEISPGHLFFYDSAVYFGNRPAIPIRIDYEFKYFGVAMLEVWVFALYCVALGLTSFYFTWLFFRYLDKEKKVPAFVQYFL